VPRAADNFVKFPDYHHTVSLLGMPRRTAIKGSLCADLCRGSVSVESRSEHNQFQLSTSGTGYGSVM